MNCTPTTLFLFLLSVSRFTNALNQENGRDVVVPHVSSEDACETYCTSFSSCEGWTFNDDRCSVEVHKLVTFQGASGFDLLQLDDDNCTFWIDDDCGVQGETLLFDECSYEISESECMGSCSEGCHHVSSPCGGSCQAEINFGAQFNNPPFGLKLLQVDPREEWLNDLRDEFAAYFEVPRHHVTIEIIEEGADYVICEITVVPANPHESVASEVHMILVPDLENESIDPNILPILATASSFRCHHGCRDEFPPHNHGATRDDFDCTAPLDTGEECFGGQNFETRIHWYFDEIAGACQFFEYTGCGGNKNNFKSELECKLQCNQEDLGVSVFCAVHLLMDNFPIDADDRQKHSPMDDTVRECRNRFHNGEIDSQEECYGGPTGRDEFQELCRRDHMNFCVMQFTELSNMRIWDDYTCLPQQCDNIDDKGALILDAIERCNVMYGACDVMMSCEHDGPLHHHTGDVNEAHPPGPPDGGPDRPPPDGSRPPPLGGGGGPGPGNLKLLASCSSNSDCGSGRYCSGGSCYNDCFSSLSTVTTLSRGEITLENLNIGDKVLAMDSETGETFYDDVYHIVHHHPWTGSTRDVDLLRLTYSHNGGGEKFVEMSREHLLYASPENVDSLMDRDCLQIGNSQGCTYMAQEIKIGSRIFVTRDGGTELVLSSVSNIEEVVSKVRGVLTLSGNIVVDGVSSSCYVIDHDTKHATLSQFRSIYEFCPWIFQTELSTVLAWMDQFRKFINVEPGPAHRWFWLLISFLICMPVSLVWRFLKRH